MIEAFFSHLNADSNVTTLVNGIFPFVIPHGTDAPAVTYRAQGDAHRVFDGHVCQIYRTAIMDVDCFATTYVAAKNIADAVEQSLVDYRGQLGTTSPAVDVDHIRMERRGPDIFETDTQYFRVPLQFVIGYEG